MDEVINDIMDTSTSTSQSDKHVGENAQVLLTGFEPFGIHKINPSWEIASQLSKKTPYIDAKRLPVDYRLVPAQIESIHLTAPYKLIIHLGVGKPGQICIESRAHNRHYHLPDNRGYVPETHAVDASCLVDLLETNVDVDALVQSVNHQLVCKSVDPGRYLCDFTYFKSMLMASRQSTQQWSIRTETEHVNRRVSQTEVVKEDEVVKIATLTGVQVLFVHVPPYQQSASHEELISIVKRIVDVALEQVSR